MKRRALAGAGMTGLVRATVAASGLLLTASPLRGQVAQLRDQYLAIRRALPSLSVDSTDLRGLSTEGGHAKVYRDSTRHVRLVQMTLYGETGKLEAEYYYQQDTLFFAYEKDFRYNVPFDITPKLAKELGTEAFDPAKTKMFENRYYFSRGRLVQWLNGRGRAADLESQEAKEAAARLLAFADSLITQLR